MLSTTNIAVTAYPHLPANENTLLLATCRGLEIIETHSIVRVEAISNYSKLFFADGRSLVVAKVLSWFEKKLDAIQFVRLHRGHLVNMRYIKSCDNGSNGEVVLVNDERLAVSRRKKLVLKRAIYQYFGHALQ